MPIQKTQRERQSVGERPLALWLLFLYVFFFPSPGPAVKKKIGLARSFFVLPEVLTLVLRPSFVLFSRVIPFLVF